ncbi:MAG: LysR family transcriptional regulator [Myxococcota bacterium]|nr:LysR family transcriptional regulator [Myxococcota bacterium]
MEWSLIDFDWNRARAFLAAAEEGSFSAAARALGSTQPTVGRQVAALEQELGVTLFERVGTGLQLTESGVQLREHTLKMATAALGVSRAAAGRSERIEGLVRVTASEAITAFLLPPVVVSLRREHPGIELELLASNALRDLLRREADIAIRNVRPQHASLIGKRLRDGSAGLYAAPAYLERVGPIRSPADLARCEILAFDQTEAMIAGLQRLGVDTQPQNYPVTAANHLVQWSLCCAGAGLCFMMTQVGEAEPRVQRVLPELTMPLQTWLVCHRELHTSRRLRTVFDALADALG